MVAGPVHDFSSNPIAPWAARGDAVGATAPPPHPPPCSPPGLPEPADAPATLQSVMRGEGVGSIRGAAIGRAGRGGHRHAQGARGGHRLADVWHEEGVAGQLVHVDAVLLAVD